MRAILPCLLTVLAAHFATGTRPLQDDESIPELRLTLRIDGVEHEFRDGQSLPITIAGKEVQVQAKVHANRRFEAAGVAFDFPRAMAFEREKRTHTTSWTLEGSNCKLLVFLFSVGKGDAMARSTLETMCERLDEKAKPPVACGVRLGGKQYDGLHARVHVSTTTIEVTSVGVTVGDHAVVVMVQDTLGADGMATKEATAMLDLLDKTFAFKN